MRVPRPVAGLPALDPADLAKGWLLAVLRDRPLAAAADVPVGRFADEAPGVCAAVLRALVDDVALDDLAAAAPALAPLGAGDPLAAAEALRGAVADAWREHPARPDVLADAQDRLAHVVHRLAAAAAAPPEIQARDTRSAAQPRAAAPTPPPGIARAAEAPEAVLARALERHATDGDPFALLIGEVTDRERWEAADPEAVDDASAAVAAALRPGDRMVCEARGRWWIVAPETDDDAARDLATTLADAAERAGDASAAFGIAACPHDAVDAEALVAHADEALLRAQAAGLPVD